MTYEVVLSYADNSENEKVVDIHIKSTNVTIYYFIFCNRMNLELKNMKGNDNWPSILVIRSAEIVKCCASSKFGE